MRGSRKRRPDRLKDSTKAAPGLHLRDGASAVINLGARAPGTSTGSHYQIRLYDLLFERRPIGHHRSRSAAENVTQITQSRRIDVEDIVTSARLLPLLDKR